MDFYSVALGLGLAAAFGSIVLVFASRFAQRSPVVGFTRTFGRIVGAVALVLFVAAGSVHFFFDHRPGSPQSLGLIGFITHHPALFVGAAVTIMAFVVERYTS